jgi:hypothetical protein
MAFRAAIRDLCRRPDATELQPFTGDWGPFDRADVIEVNELSLVLNIGSNEPRRFSLGNNQRRHEDSERKDAF